MPDRVIVLEERLTGPEVSFFVVANGGHYVPLLSAQDHKRIFDNDKARIPVAWVRSHRALC